MCKILSVFQMISDRVARRTGIPKVRRKELTSGFGVAG